MRIVTTEQMRQLEHASVDAGSTWAGLMEQAGWGVAQEALRLLGVGRGKQAVVLVGPGNNGGDGLVVARHLHDAGIRVTLYVWRRDEAAADANWDRCRQRDITTHFAAHDSDRATLRQLLDEANLAVDALLGMGTTRPVTGDLAEIVDTLNTARQQRQSLLVLSIDLPTGIHSDTGALLERAVRADLTVATGLVKRGLLLQPGNTYAGNVALAEIVLPSAALETIMSETLTAQLARGLLPARPADSHKGTFGKALIVAGSIHYPGAATLSTTSAARVGAGLVTLATGRSIAGGARTPEITLLPLPEADWGTIGEAAAVELLKHLEGYTSMLIGPGLGHEESTGKFLQRLLGLDTRSTARARVGFRLSSDAVSSESETERSELPPIVIDADGLNLLAQIDNWWEHLPKGRFVLTPHPGEMLRLLKAEKLEDDTVQVASDAASRWGQIVVLKGGTTVIAHPEGRTLVHAQANPALATAGTGDVLAGAITGLLAQKVEPFEAAALGVYLHGAAGALVRDEVGDTGAIASDLLLRLPKAITTLRKG